MSLPETCPTCAHPRPGRYCANCGERRTAPDELSLGSFFKALGSEVLPGVETEEDRALGRAGGRVIRTVYMLFRWPGRLTADYVAGIRRPYLKPIQVYLTISVIFFIFGNNFFQYDLSEYEYVVGYGDTADLISAELVRRAETLDVYKQAFRERLTDHKKTMFALIVPFYAVGMVGLFRRRRVGEHMIFSIHVQAALLLFMIGPLLLFFKVLAAVARVLAQINPAFSPWLNVIFGEVALGLFIYMPFVVYNYVAVRRVYGAGRAAALTKSVALALWHIFLLVFVFKLGLFWSSYLSLKWFG